MIWIYKVLPRQNQFIHNLFDHIKSFEVNFLLWGIELKKKHNTHPVFVKIKCYFDKKNIAKQFVKIRKTRVSFEIRKY